MALEQEKAAMPPYVSFRTFLNLLDRLHKDGIPQHIDRHYWSSFMAGGLGQQLMVGLKFLGLIDPQSNSPTTALERLVEPEQRKAALAELIQERYTALWESNINLSRTTPGHLDNAFKTAYNAEGETRRKAVTFFVHAAKFAEIPLSPQVADKTRQRRPSSTSNGRVRSKTTVKLPASPPAGDPEQPRDTNREQDHNFQGSGPYTILQSLLLQLPQEGRWTAERRGRWLRALEANVDLLVIVEDEGEDTEYEEYFDEEDAATFH